MPLDCKKGTSWFFWGGGHHRDWMALLCSKAQVDNTAGCIMVSLPAALPPMHRLIVFVFSMQGQSATTNSNTTTNTASWLFFFFLLQHWRQHCNLASARWTHGVKIPPPKTLLSVDCFIFYWQNAAKKQWWCGKVFNATGCTALPPQKHHYQCHMLFALKFYFDAGWRAATREMLPNATGSFFNFLDVVLIDADASQGCQCLLNIWHQSKPSHQRTLSPMLLVDCFSFFTNLNGAITWCAMPLPMLWHKAQYHSMKNKAVAQCTMSQNKKQCLGS